MSQISFGLQQIEEERQTIRNNVSGRNGDLGVLNPSPDANRALVNILNRD